MIPELFAFVVMPAAMIAVGLAGFGIFAMTAPRQARSLRLGTGTRVPVGDRYEFNPYAPSSRPGIVR